MLANTTDMGGKLKIEVYEDINNANAEELKKIFQEATEKGKPIVLNLEKVKSISSSGIGKILMLQKNLKQYQAELTIEGISPTLHEMFKLIKLNELIPIKP